MDKEIYNKLAIEQQTSDLCNLKLEILSDTAIDIRIIETLLIRTCIIIERHTNNARLVLEPGILLAYFAQ